MPEPTDRRELLKKIAAAGAGAALAPVVISTPAFADSGTQKCRFGGFTNAATAASSVTRVGNSDNVNFTITFAGPTGGTCPCAAGTAPVIRYQFWIQIRRYTIGGTLSSTQTVSSTDWTLAGSVGTTQVTLAGTAPYYEVDLQVGWRAQCPGVGATPARMCRFATFSSGRVGPIGNGGTIYTVAASAMTSTSTPSNLTGC